MGAVLPLLSAYGTDVTALWWHRGLLLPTPQVVGPGAHVGCSTSGVAPGPRAGLSHGHRYPGMGALVWEGFAAQQRMLEGMAGGSRRRKEITSMRAKAAEAKARWQQSLGTGTGPEGLPGVGNEGLCERRAADRGGHWPLSPHAMAGASPGADWQYETPLCPPASAVPL